MPRRYWFTTLVALGILVLSLVHLDRAPKLNVAHSDKIGHFIAYLVLTFTWLVEYARAHHWSIKNGRRLIAILLICICYGVGLEGLQATAAVHRNFDIWDMGANALGACLGFGIFALNRTKLAQLLK